MNAFPQWGNQLVVVALVYGALVAIALVTGALVQRRRARRTVSELLRWVAAQAPAPAPENEPGPPPPLGRQRLGGRDGRPSAD